MSLNFVTIGLDIALSPIQFQNGNQYPPNTLRPRQNGRHFPDDIFNCIFLNENV